MRPSPSVAKSMEWPIMNKQAGILAVLAVIAVGLGIMFWLNNNGNANHANKKNNLFEIIESEEEEADDPRQYPVEQPGQFGIDRLKEGKDVKPAPFDGKRAIRYLQSICELGPRISGSKSMRAQQQIIKKHFEEIGAKVTFQSFTAKQNSVKGEVEMTNIIVSFQPEKKRRVIICSHYDTRPIADQEKDPRDWK